MKTPHSFNEEKRRAGLSIGSFAMQSVPDQAPEAGQAERTGQLAKRKRLFRRMAFNEQGKLYPMWILRGLWQLAGRMAQ